MMAEKQDEALALEAVKIGLLMTSIKERRAGYTYQQELCENVAVARDALAEGSAARCTAGSVPLVAQVKSVEFEESSKRWVIYYRAPNTEGDIEHVRTLRTDTPEGRHFNALAPKLANTRCLIYKSNVPMPDRPGQKGRSIRIASCIIPLSTIWW